MAHLEDVAVFVAVVERASFAGAASRLRLPPTTVSRRVRQLEDRLGTRLLNRTTRSLSLTEAGAAYFESCRAGLALIADADAGVRGLQAEPSGTIRVSAPIDFAAGLFGDLIAEFVGQNPKVKIELQLTDERLDLLRTRIDVAIRTGELPASSLVAKKLGTGRRVWCASPGYLAARGTPERPGDLADHDCIVRGDSTEGVIWTFTNGKSVETVPVKARICANVMSFCVVAAVAGLGIAQMPEGLARPEIAAGRLVTILDKYADDRGGIYLMFPSNRHASAAVKAFVTHVERWVHTFAR
ncbi:MAG: LysR family transcriptional regulator [Devosia sp.]|uniref:LysR family transcriptional regulator n=1 Tax=Devosia sp. TaxID=1871048 RepID=UPI0026175B39|nr:LysR family transcriptional regulator [Devosia sp.]MDB5540214.1 LysR family transcriptional regulator [Devosia sp.]